jgi:hypothetical protein
MSQQAELPHLGINLAGGTQRFLAITAKNSACISKGFRGFDMNVYKASPEAGGKTVMIFAVA